MRGSLQAQERLLRTASESMNGLRAVKAASAEGESIRRFDEANRDVLREELRVRFAQAMSSPLVETISILAVSGLALVAARQIIEPASFNAVFGAVRLLYGCGVAFGPPAMAAMVDTTGRFDLPLAIVAAVLAFHHVAFVVLARRGQRA
jgi:ABC-type multidrug transport system fused ATPase/permease subunit